MANKWQAVDICAARFSRLEANGVPDPGANNIIVTDDLTQIAYTFEIEAGTRSTQRNGCGGICFTRETPDKPLGSNLTADLCFTDAELMELATGAVLLTDGGETIGWGLRPTDAGPLNGVGVETWSLAWENDQQKIHPITGGPAYLRRVWPRQRFALSGTLTQAEGLMIQQIIGKGEANENFYDGPANDIPIADYGAYAEFLSAAPPVATDGYATLAAS
jgi:hypothetical protein